MTRDEALKSMTIWPAYAAFQEHIMGSLTPGKFADFVILDHDIMTVPDREILGTSRDCDVYWRQGGVRAAR